MQYSVMLVIPSTFAVWTSGVINWDGGVLTLWLSWSKNRLLYRNCILEAIIYRGKMERGSSMVWSRTNIWESLITVLTSLGMMVVMWWPNQSPTFSNTTRLWSILIWVSTTSPSKPQRSFQQVCNPIKLCMVFILGVIMASLMQEVFWWLQKG